MPQLHTVALMREVLARIALARGDALEVEMQGRELAAVAERTGSARHHAIADFAMGCGAVLGGEPDRGRNLLHAALAGHAELGLERGAADALEELALLAADGGDSARAARLAAAAARTRERLRCAPLRLSVDRLEAARADCVARDGQDGWDAAWAEGEDLPLAAAIAYARRARGPRDRPSVGWASLTPGETLALTPYVGWLEGGIAPRTVVSCPPTARLNSQVSPAGGTAAMNDCIAGVVTERLRRDIPIASQ